MSETVDAILNHTLKGEGADGEPHPYAVDDKGHLPVEADGFYIVRATVPGIGAGAIYASGDAVGSVFNIRVPPIGIIEAFKLIDPDDDTLALTAHMFTEQVTGAADNAAFTISAADAVNWVTSVTFDAPVDIGSAKVAEEAGTTYYSSAKGQLWVQCSTTGTPTIAAGASPILVVCIRVGREVTV